MIPGEMILNSHPGEREHEREKGKHKTNVSSPWLKLMTKKLLASRSEGSTSSTHKNLKTSEWHDTITNWEHYLQISTSIPSTLLSTYKDQSGHNRFVIAVTLV